jgi:AcrR family transcriptional regulator
MLFMAERGLYAKGRAKRAEILDVALDVIARAGYSAATVKELADAVGLSQNGLLHYFGSKDALFAEILRRRDEIAQAEVEFQSEDFADTLVDRLLDAVDLELTSPGMAQLSLRMTGEATEPGHLAHDYLRERYANIRIVVEEAVVRFQQDGRVSADVDADAVAALVYASWDGLMIQWMYDKTVDVRANMAYLLRALGIETMTAPQS